MVRATRCFFVAVSVSACGAAWCAEAAEPSASAPSSNVVVSHRQEECLSHFLDPNHVNTTCGLQFQLRYKLGPQIRIALGISENQVAIRTTYSLSDLISWFPFCTRIAAIAARSSVTNAEEDTAARPSEPHTLIADARTIGPRNNAVVILSFTLE